MRNALLFVLTLLGASLCFGAEVYPGKPVRVIVPYGPGGNTDIAARVISQELSQQLGKSFIVDNRPGATGTVGTGIVAKSAPDGYTLALADTSWSIVPGLYKSLSYNVPGDFTPITQIMRVPNVLVVNPSSNVKTLKGFIALAQANPGKLNFASSGPGSLNHLMPELFKKAAKVDIMHIPYKGAGETITELLGGRVHMVMSPVPPVLPHVKSGKLLALAVTTDGKRVPSMPDVPTMGEAGIPGMVIYYWAGLAGPAGMPKNVVDTLQAGVVKALSSPSVKDKLVAMSAELVGSRPDAFTQFIRAELRRWAEAIKSAGITPL